MMVATTIKMMMIRLYLKNEPSYSTQWKAYFIYVIGNCDAISYYKKMLREDAQTAEMELIASQFPMTKLFGGNEK